MCVKEVKLCQSHTVHGCNLVIYLNLIIRVTADAELEQVDAVDELYAVHRVQHIMPAAVTVYGCAV